MIKEITGYKLSNGQILEDREEAEKLQSKIDFKKVIEDLVDFEDFFNDQGDLIKNFIIDNANRFSKLAAVCLGFVFYFVIFTNDR